MPEPSERATGDGDRERDRRALLFVAGLIVAAAVLASLHSRSIADQSQPTELMLKGGPDGKNYIGPAEDPVGSQRDREIVAFDGRVLITRFTDQEVAGRYGTSVYVRCGAETAPAKKKKAAPKTAAQKT